MDFIYKIMASIFGAATISYLIFAFISASFNITDWHMLVRVYALIAAVLLSTLIVFSLATHEFEETF